MAKKEYLQEIRQRYRKARSRREKIRLLDELCATCGYHRKHAIRAVAGPRFWTAPLPARRGAKATYGQQVVRPLKIIWLAANLPCSKRLKALLPLWLRGYQMEFGALAPELESQLRSISASTIDRLLTTVRLEHQGRGRATTKPGTLLRRNIPIKTGQWDESRPGFLEADTVAHCGSTTAGQFAWTLDCVDIATGWTEQRAVWAKSEKDIVEQMKSIEKSIPFPLLGFDSDNGGEFLNYALLEHFLKRRRPVEFTRSRSYRKNDNSHVEQKNWTHVRQWLGYDRFEQPQVIALMNDLYENEWRLYHNFYCPSVKLQSKERVGAKTIKRHDEPKTPYQRLLASDQVTPYTKRGLKQVFDNTNPFHLRRRMEDKIRKIFAALQ